MKKILIILFLLIYSNIFAQPFTLNDDIKVTMYNGANIIIDPSGVADIQKSIRTTGTGNGYIVCEDEINKIKIWLRDQMFAGAILTIPYATSTGTTVKIKITSITPGSNDGMMIFSTAPTTNDNKLISTSAYPSTVTNMNGLSGGDNSANVVDRFWFVDFYGYTTIPVSTYAFYYTDSDLGTITESNLQAQVWNGTIWVLPPVGSVFTASNDVYNIPSVATGQCWTLVDKNVPLPIELLYFIGDCYIGDGLLHFEWETASESNSNKFIIEKSSDLYNWISVADVNASGNSTTSKLYSKDIPIQYEIYYRLKQIDINGTTQIFNPITLECKNQLEKNFIIYPNPTKDEIIIEKIGEDVELINIELITDIGEKILSRYEFENKTFNISLKNYSNQLYILKIWHKRGYLISKIIKLK